MPKNLGEPIEQFEDGTEDEFDVVVLKDGEEPEKEEPEVKENQSGKMITDEELEELRRKGDSAAAIQSGISQLGEQLRVPAPQQAPQSFQMPTITAEEFEKDFFNPGKSLEVLDRALQQKVLPIMIQQQQEIALTRKRLLAAESETKETFSKYSKEIEAEHASMPQQEKLQADCWDKAYQRVIARHQSDIISDKVNERVKDEVAKALAEYGIKVENGKVVQPEKSQQPKSSMYTENGGTTMAPSTKSVKKKVYLTPKDVERMNTSGLDYTNEDHVKIYLRKIGKGA